MQMPHRVAKWRTAFLAMFAVGAAVPVIVVLKQQAARAG